MDNIRSAANHLIIKIIFAIIILCFVFTGVGFFGFSGNNNDAQLYIAKVDGEGISRAAFESQARQAIANSGSFSNDDSFSRLLRREVFSTQINNYLVYQLAKRLKTDVSNEQIKEYIRKQPVFFDQGKFSNKRYLELLANNGYTPDSYAELLRTVLLNQQVKEALLNSNFVLPSESTLSLLEDETRDIYIATVTPSIVNMDDVVITPEDEQKYYDEHQQQFAKKERIKFNYIANLKTDIEATVTDAEIKHEYESNSSLYQFPAKNSYSIIYVTDKDEADAIANELKTKSFDEIANEINKDSVISPYGKNGSLGWFANDDKLPEPFKEANLTKIGQISAPIAVDNGYLIVKLDAKQDGAKMDYNYAKVLISKKLTSEKVDKIFDEKKAKLEEALNKGSDSLKDIAEKAGLTMQESDWTNFNDKLSVLKNPEVRDVAFGSEMLIDNKATGKISEIIPIGRDQEDGGIIIQVVDYRPEGIAPFEEVEKVIHQKIYNNIANERFQSSVDDTMQELNEKGSAKGISFTKRYTLTRTSSEFNPEVVNMIFNMIPSVNNETTYAVKMLNNTAYIVALVKVTPATKERDISAELLPTLTKNINYSLLTELRSKAKIEIMPDANL